MGTRGAYILDDKMNILGKVPITELQATLRSIESGITAIVFDGSIEREIVRAAEHSNLHYLVGIDSKVRPGETRVNLLTAAELQ